MTQTERTMDRTTALRRRGCFLRYETQTSCPFPPSVNTRLDFTTKQRVHKQFISGGPETELDTVKQLNQNGVIYDLILAGT